MSDFAPRGRNLFAVLVTLVSFASPLAAATMPPPLITRPSLPSMVDARVNAKDSYLSAVGARPGREAAGRNAARSQAALMVQAIRSLRATMPGLDVKLSNQTGGATSVRNARGALTAAAPGRGSEEIVRGFLLQRGGLYGLSAADVSDLVVLGDSSGGSTGLRMLRMEQQIGGVPIFQSETRFLLDRNGRLMKSVGYLIPNARSVAPNLAGTSLLGPAEAIVRLLAADGKTANAGTFTVTGQDNGWTRIAETDGFVAGEISARQVLFPLAPGLLVPAWSLVVFTSGTQDWYAVVDAETGDLLWRKNIRNHVSTHEARFRVYVQADGVTPADSPAPQSPSSVAPGSGTQFGEILPTIVNMSVAQNIVTSPNGWIDDCPGGVCTANETQTLGNNVLACMDRAAPGNVCDTDAASVLDGNGRPTGNPDGSGRNRDFLGTAPRDFQTNFLPPPQGGAGGAEVGQNATGAGAGGTNAFDQFRRGSVTNQFYVSNWYHDQLFALGFDEAAANFQQINFSGMGLGGDRVLVDVQDASGTNNANFGTPPDGISGRAQMFRFTFPIVDRDGGLDNVILIHELTHGTSNRLVGNAAGLNWDPAGAMGEGWSDFYGMALLNNTPADDPDAQYPAGAYATFKLGGLLDNYLYAIRRFPYSTDNAVNPLTWADVDDVIYDESGGIAPSPLDFGSNGAMEVHNAGEIWANTLWEVRSRIIADPAGAAGSVPAGNQTALRIVTGGLKMTPNDPQFIDARDAILDADCAINLCANEDSIWGGFADRGLGFEAAEPFFAMISLFSSHVGIKESFNLPVPHVADPATDVDVDDTATNNNNAIDPGEPVKLNVSLTNPWRRATKAITSATATLITSTPGITILDGTAAYGAIAPQATVAGSDTFIIQVDPAVLCGSAIDFNLSVVSNLGTTLTGFQLRVGAASGTDPVVTYTGNPTPDLPIGDQEPRGVFHQINITDDFVIADLDFRVDSITHTFVDDLEVELRAPTGLGTDIVGLIGLNTVDAGSGDNLTNTLIDDDQPFDAAHDMIQATAAANSPGYDGPWIPVYNSPSFADPLFFGVPADPVGNLSYFDGLSTKGTWTALAADIIGGDVGTLNAWSMLVTPVHFACVPFVGGAPVVSATKTVAGTFTEGGSITYTVTLTNTGAANQNDNPGNEFTDTLPNTLTLVSAVASSGLASTAGNTVNWNGSIGLLGGSVTITITATINAGAAGNQKCNQGNFLYDADNNGTNEAPGVTDDPGTGTPNDATCFAVSGSVNVTATKTVSGTFQPGSTVTYTVTLTNNGTLPQADNPGFEFTDTLPAGVTLTGADDGGNPGTFSNVGNTVNWNGAIAANGGTVVITIQATITGSPGQTISNQGQVSFDANGDGTNDTVGSTDDPGEPGGADPTDFVIGQGGFNAEIPTVSEVGLAILGLSLLLAAWMTLRRRKTTV